MADATQRPTVRLFVVCADAVLSGPGGDLTSGWWEVINPYHTVWMQPGVGRGFQVPRVTLYFQLTDGVGAFTFGVVGEQLDLANPQRDRVIARSKPLTATFDNPWDVIEETVDLVGVGFPRPGQYRFRLLEKGQEIEGGTTFPRVMPGDTK
jgi:hypothetical protein